MSRPARACLPDGRLHLQHGPIDLVIRAWGAARDTETAYAQAWGRFQGVLDELVAELAMLRTPIGGACPLARFTTARRMVAAVWPHRRVFITPMAAVAGAVADEILQAMLMGTQLDKAFVNNGGDIAVHVRAGHLLDAGIVSNLLQPALDASLRLSHSCGVATSGWRGRSQSLGIADAATIVAATAAQADAAATLVANAVDVRHAGVHRRPARELKEDSDLGELPVTVGVDPLPPAAVDAALDCGLGVAQDMARKGFLHGACIALQGGVRVLAANPETNP